MLIGVLVGEAVNARVVGWVGEDDSRCLSVAFRQRRKCLKVLTVEQHAVGLIIYIAYRFEQTRREIRRRSAAYPRPVSDTPSEIQA